VEEWKIPNVESAIFIQMNNLQIFKFLKKLTKLPSFIGGKKSKVNWSHPNEVGEKELFHLDLG
jgi:hypothetical protein